MWFKVRSFFRPTLGKVVDLTDIAAVRRERTNVR